MINICMECDCVRTRLAILVKVSSLTQASRLSLTFDAVEYIKCWELHLFMTKSVVPCDAVFVHRHDNVACMTSSLDGYKHTLATSVKLEP